MWHQVVVGVPTDELVESLGLLSTVLGRRERTRWRGLTYRSRAMSTCRHWTCAPCSKAHKAIGPQAPSRDAAVIGYTAAVTTSPDTADPVASLGDGPARGRDLQHSCRNRRLGKALRRRGGLRRARRRRPVAAGDLDSRGRRGARLAGRELARLRVARGSSLRCPVPRPGHEARGKRWGPRNPRRYRSLWVGDAENLARLPRTRWDQARHGTWGIALLSRLPLRGVEAFELGRLRRDPAQRRAAVIAEIAVASASITVVGTHLAHFTHGSPILLQRLRRQLPTAAQPGVLAGDMNFWGPPLSLGLPGWRRAVRARTYPSWRAHSQIDHIFVTEAVTVISAARSRLAARTTWRCGRGSPSTDEAVTNPSLAKSDPEERQVGQGVRPRGKRGECCWRSRFPAKVRNDRAWAPPGSTTRRSSS